MNFLKNRKIRILLFLQLFLLSGLVSFVIMPTQAKTTQSNVTDTQLSTSMQNADLVAIYDKNASTNIKVDGVMGPNEYPEQFYSNYTGMTVAMAYNGTSLFVYVSAPTSGWVGVGFNTYGYGMVGADAKVGWVNDVVPSGSGNVVNIVSHVNDTVDDYFAARYSMPGPDGGAASNDVTQSNGTETLYLGGAQGQNTTNLEFVMNMVPKNINDTLPLSSSDKSNPPITKDKILQPNNTYSLLLAYGPNENINGIQHDSLGLQHVRKGIQTLFIAPESVKPRTETQLSFHLPFDGTATENTPLTGYVTLEMANGTPVANAQIGIYQQALISDNLLQAVSTNSSGMATFNTTVLQQYKAPVSLVAKFTGDVGYKKAESSPVLISYTGSVPTEDNPFLIIPTSFDFLVPWMTGLAAVGTVFGIWVAFAYVIYTVIFKNAVQPNAKKTNKVNNHENY